jgi:chromate reductase
MSKGDGSGMATGGTRAALALRPILSELGCLPVSAMVHIPHAQEVFQEDGSLLADTERWESYMDRCLHQLVWWGQAAQQQRQVVDPFETSPAFSTQPLQRDAP